MLKAHKLGHTMERPSLCLFASARWRLCLVKVLSNLGKSMEFPIDAEQQSVGEKSGANPLDEMKTEAQRRKHSFK